MHTCLSAFSNPFVFLQILYHFCNESTFHIILIPTDILHPDSTFTMSSPLSFVFTAGGSSSSNPNPPPSSSVPSSDQAAPSSSFSSGASNTGNTGQFTFGTTSISVQRHLEEQIKEQLEKLKIARNAIEAQRRQIADADKGRAMAEVRVVDLEIELEAEKKKASEKILQLEAQSAAKEDALVSEVERLGNELREKDGQLIHEMEEKWTQFGQIQEVTKALSLVKGPWNPKVQKVEDDCEVDQAALEYHIPSIEDINAGVWAMAKGLQEEKILTQVLGQKVKHLDEEVKKSKEVKSLLRFLNIQQKYENSNTKAKLFQKILDLKAENQNVKKELSILGPWPPTLPSTFSSIVWACLFIVLIVMILASGGFWMAFGWQEQLGAFGYGGPNVDNWFTRLLAIICVLSEDLLLE